MRHTKIIILATLLFIATPGVAQQALTLEQCRQQALKANHDIRMANEKVEMADDLKAAALSQFFPKLSANGTYLYNNRNMQLLSDDQQSRINNIGTDAMGQLNISQLMGIISSISQSNPQLAYQLIQLLSSNNLAGSLNGMGERITDALNVDLTNVFAGAVTLTQPIYMGGKIRAAYQAAKLYDEMAHLEQDQETEKQLIAVDEAFWRVVSLEHKQQLAQQYYDLLNQLSSDVDAMVEAEVATPADQTKVRVKLNEAEMSLTKAQNGLVLCRMVLNQMCGRPLNEEFNLVVDTTLQYYTSYDTIDMQQVLRDRNEMKMLQLGEGIANSGVKMARSALLPNIAATGGYTFSNPNFYNGYSKEFGGSLMAGVVVNVPIAHPGAIFATKAAKHKRNIVHMQMEQAQEKIELQVNKLNYELAVANRKLTQAQTALQNAEDNLRNATESFSAGVISSGDLMQAQTAWVSAQSELIDAEIEIRMDYLYLNQALGK